MGPDNVGLAIFVLLLSAAHLVSAQSETAILDMYVDCIEFEKLCGQLKPCENGAKCSPTYNDDGYKCDCPLGYGGKNCETKQSELLRFCLLVRTRFDCSRIVSEPRSRLAALVWRDGRCSIDWLTIWLSTQQKAMKSETFKQKYSATTAC